MSYLEGVGWARRQWAMQRLILYFYASKTGYIAISRQLDDIADCMLKQTMKLLKYLEAASAVRILYVRDEYVT